MHIATANSRLQKEPKFSQVHTPHSIINKKRPKYQLISQTKANFFSQQHISHSSQKSPHSFKCEKSDILYSSNQIYKTLEIQENTKEDNQDSYLCFGIKVVPPFNNQLLNKFPQDRKTTTNKKQQQNVVTNSQETNSSKKKVYLDRNQQIYKFEKLPLKVTSSQVLSTSLASLNEIQLVSKQSKFKTKKHLQDAKSIISQDISSSLMEFNTDQSQLIERKLDIFEFVTPIEESRCCDMCKAIDTRYNSLVTFKVFTEEKLDNYIRQVKIMQILSQLQTKMALEPKQTLMQKIEANNKIVVLFQPFHKALSEFIRNIEHSRNQFLQFFNLQIISLIKKLANRGVYLTKNLQLDDFVESEGEWKLRCLCKFKLASQAQVKKIDLSRVVPFVWLE